MNARWGLSQTRLEAAKELLSKCVDSLQGVPNLELALRVYGHQSMVTATYQDCEDTRLEVPFAAGNHLAIKNRILSIKAKGTTPIARSLEASAGDFPDAESKNIIILITDGLEACDNDPCLIAKKLKDKGINVTPFVIGLGMDLSYLEKFKCIGEYSEAETKEQFKKALGIIINKSLNNSSTQINLNDINGKPSETDVTMFLYEHTTKNIRYTLTHTLNVKGNPDTLLINPDVKYDLLVHTIPPVEKKNITIYKNMHNTIVVDAPQGWLKVRAQNAARPYVIETRVTQTGKNNTLNVQQLNEAGKYIVGKYDVEILSLPRIYKTVDISQSNTTFVDIPAPGIMMYKAPAFIVGQIFVKADNEEWKWVCNMDHNSLSGSWILLPGTYKVVYRQKQLKLTEYTTEREFKIVSNKTTTLNL